MHHLRILRVLAATGLLALLVAPTVAAYETPVPQSVTVSVPSGTLPCGINFPVSATVLDANGQPIANAEATWTLTTVVGSQDAVVNPTSMTDGNGVAVNEVFLQCVVGERNVEARVGDAFGGAVLGITSAGLPNTSTPPTQTPTWTVALAAAAVMLGGILGLRSIVARR